MDEKRHAGFTDDGYIADQDCFADWRYRTMSADINGCGPIAFYNLLHALGREADWREVFRELESLHRVNMPGPTSMRAMRLMLARHLPQARETQGREAALEAAEKARAGIFRYWEGREPHFIAFVRQDGDRFRFFNVSDGLEDCEMSMERFGREHLRGGLCIVLTVEVSG